MEQPHNVYRKSDVQQCDNRDLARWGAIFALIGIASLCFFTFGCTKREEANPPPSSSYPKSKVYIDAYEWAKGEPGRIVKAVAPTGSMLPFFGSNALLLLEPIKALDLTNGDVGTYEKGGLLICHRVDHVDANGDVVFHGDANGNTNTDGIIAAAAVNYRVAGILYATR